MNLSRRSFCRLPLLAGLTLSSRQPQASNGKTVIVVGAGIAGLAAAIDLKAVGFTVIVLEGRDRAGGRIFTSSALGGMPLDMGATWIHGIRRNPIFELCARYRLKVVETNYDAIVRYGSDGALLHAAREARREYDFAQLRSAISKAQHAKAADRSLGNFIADYARAQQLTAERLKDLRYSVTTEIEHEYAADAAQLSLAQFDQGDQFGGPDVLFPDGYSQLIERLRVGLDIRTDHVVRRIAWDAGGVRIATNNGTFPADYVVVTLPLGVLKHGDVVFIPDLPAIKRAAIARLGMGVLNKCYLRFPRVFWDAEADLIGYVNTAPGRWCEWCNIYRYTREPVLLGFNAGVFGEQLEAFADEAIIASAMAVLRTLYGAAIPDPTGALISRWRRDAFARGAYSYLPPGASGDDYDALAASVAGRLFFAGEATSRQYPGTVHGAWLSGRKAAAEIVAAQI